LAAACVVEGFGQQRLGKITHLVATASSQRKEDDDRLLDLPRRKRLDAAR
jgi:hypothetical protein